MSEITITKENFQQEVINSDMPILVDFWASWCGPCNALAPVVEELANDYAGKCKVGKVNVDEQQELAAQFQVMTIPTLILFKDGKAVNSMIGVHPKAEIEKMLKSRA